MRIIINIYMYIYFELFSLNIFIWLAKCLQVALEYKNLQIYIYMNTKYWNR